MKNDPIHDIKRIHREMDELFMELYMGSGMSSKPGRPYLPATDVFYAEDLSKMVVIFELPGIDVGSLRVHVNGRNLTVEGQRHQPDGLPDGHFYHHMEIEYGSFRRVLALPFEVEAPTCKATYADGMLTMNFVPATEHHDVTDLAIDVIIGSDGGGR